jgi:phosphohistidine phosphatase
MFLYLVQHAEARRQEEDPARDLTATGRQDIARLAHYVGGLNLGITRIWHSGKTRALRTAEILAAALQPSPAVAATDGLAPLDNPAEWAGRLGGLEEDVVLVGHLPHLARLAALLTCGNQERGVVNFKMGGMVCLRRVDPGSWGVEWMLIPALIR